MIDDPSSHDRADVAFRSVLRSDRVDEIGIEPSVVRGRLRRRRGLVATVAAAIVVVLALATVPLLRQFSSDSTAGDPTWRTPPAGWRIEQYRDVSIFVPDSWGYASAPTEHWCAASPDGRPLLEQREPYVSLGVPNVMAPPPQKNITRPCPAQPESLLSEHVELYAPTIWGSNGASPTPQRHGDWWVQVRTFHPDQEPTAIRVVSKDRELVERIVNSAVLAGPCAASSPVQENRRNPTPIDLAAFDAADRAVICQYEPGPIDHRQSPVIMLTGLRAARVLTGDRARSLIAALETASRSDSVSISCPAHEISTRLAIEIRLFARGRTGSVYLTAGNCTNYGGNYADLDYIDLGGALHRWTPAICNDVAVLPVVFRDRAGSWVCSR